VVTPDTRGVPGNASEDFLLLVEDRVFMKTTVVSICPAGYSNQYDGNILTRGTI
jgi:hypothetical protein